MTYTGEVPRLRSEVYPAASARNAAIPVLCESCTTLVSIQHHHALADAEDHRTVAPHENGKRLRVLLIGESGFVAFEIQAEQRIFLAVADPTLGILIVHSAMTQRASPEY